MKKFKFVYGGKSNEFSFIYTNHEPEEICLDNVSYMIFYAIRKDYIGYIYVPYEKFYSRKNVLVIKNTGLDGKQIILSFKKQEMISKHILYRNSYRNLDYYYNNGD